MSREPPVVSELGGRNLLSIDFDRIEKKGLQKRLNEIPTEIVAAVSYWQTDNDTGNR